MQILIIVILIAKFVRFIKRNDMKTKLITLVLLQIQFVVCSRKQHLLWKTQLRYQEVNKETLNKHEQEYKWRLKNKE
jgi:hypothetical protein